MTKVCDFPKCGRGKSRCLCVDAPMPANPTSVQEARHALYVRHRDCPCMREGYSCAKCNTAADRLIAAVRAERDAEIRAMVEGMPTFDEYFDGTEGVSKAALLSILANGEGA